MQLSLNLLDQGDSSIMTARRDKSPNTNGWPFRDSAMDAETTVTMNQRMIGQLLQREVQAANLPAWQSRSLIGLGIEVAQSREENTGLSLKEAGKRSGLDPAFLAIIEAGKAVPEEITSDVLKALVRGVKAKSSDLESAMSVQESSVIERTPAGQIMSALISLCQPLFLNRATAFKSMVAAPASEEDEDEGVLLDDDAAGVSYKIGGFVEGEPPALIFYEFQNPQAPLRGWHVSVRSGLQELVSGVTDDQGIFRFPSSNQDFPENAHMLIRKSI